MYKEKFLREYKKDNLGKLTIYDIPVSFSDTDMNGFGKVSMGLDDFCDAIEESDNYPGLDHIDLALVHGSSLYKNYDENKMPEDLDILLISERYFDGVVANRRVIEPDIDERTYGRDEVKDSIVHVEKPKLTGMFFRTVGMKDSAIKLHLSYRDRDQFENALEDVRGLDTVSINAYNEGVPLFGKLPDYGERNQLHRIEWHWDCNYDNLNAYII